MGSVVPLSRREPFSEEMSLSYLTGEAHHRRLAAQLRRSLLDRYGFTLLIDEPSPHGSFFASCLADQGPEALRIVSILCEAGASFVRLLDEYALSLGLTNVRNGVSKLWQVVSLLLEEQRQGIRHVLLLEYAGRLSDEVLLQLGRMAQAEKPGLLSVCLLADSSLAARFQSPPLAEHPRLLVAQLDARRLAPDEMGAFLQHHLDQNGLRLPDIFPPTTVDAITVLADGDPGAATRLARDAFAATGASALTSAQAGRAPQQSRSIAPAADVVAEQGALLAAEARQTATMYGVAAGSWQPPARRVPPILSALLCSIALVIAYLGAQYGLALLFGPDEASMVSAIRPDAPAPMSKLERQASDTQAAAPLPDTSATAALPPSAPAPEGEHGGTIGDETAAAPPPSPDDAPADTDLTIEAKPAETRPPTAATDTTDAAPLIVGDEMTSSIFAALPPDDAAISATVPTEAAPTEQPAEAVPPPATAPTPASPAASGAAIALLVTRGDQLLGAGDVAAARLFYERAVAAGEARAALGLGKTFDPLFVGHLKVAGVVADARRSALWYREAIRLGDEEAAVRLSALLAKYPQ